MKKQILFTLALLSFGMLSCDVDQTREVKMPEVDVDIDTKAGQLPAYDVDWADVNVGTQTRTVKVPKVVVVMEEVEVEVPYVDVDMPTDGEKEEITLQVEAEVSGETKELQIQEVYATGKQLYVISKLENTGQDLGKETMRISDRLVLNAPDDLNVKHYIIGTRPEGQFNNSYTYIASRNSIAGKLSNGKAIYKR